MGAFFRSGRFKVLLAIFVVFAAFMVRAIWTGGFAPLMSQITSAVTTPLQSFSAFLSGQAEGAVGDLFRAKELAGELEDTKQQLQSANEQLLEMEQLQNENEQLRQQLEIKEQYGDEYNNFTFQAASVIGRDHNDRFGSFIIDKGSHDGIAPRSPVITADGLVGIVDQVSLTQSKVITILDVSLNVGAVDVRSQDTGIVSGTVELAAQKLCQMSFLPRESGASKGDLVRTSGSDSGGLFPKNLIIGNVVEVQPDSSGLSLNAIIQPAAHVDEVKDVFVITSFLGQGETLSGGQ